MKGAQLSILGFAICFVAALMGASKAYQKALERDETYRFLSDALDPVARAALNVEWHHETETARPVTEGDQTLIGAAIARAWQRLSMAQSTGDDNILIDSFGGTALARAGVSVRDADRHGGQMVVLWQTITPVFFHKDGSVFQARLDMTVARYHGGEKGLGFYTLRQDSGLVTMMNETVGWRMASYELRASTPFKQSSASEEPPRLHGFNYYPAGAPWKDFWRKYNPAEVEADMARMVDFGANSIRFFLDYDTFLDPKSREAATGNLEHFLDHAQQSGLHLVPTLFDLKGSYAPGSWGANAVYLNVVLPILAKSDAVVMIDLKNEPDLDYATNGRATVDAWLFSFLGLIKDRIPDVPVTIGWSSAETAYGFVDAVDVVTYHAYENIVRDPYTFADLSAHSGDKPVMVTEIGETSYELALGFPASPEKQADRLRERLAYLEDADGLFVWTLNDFAVVDPGAVGRSPWVQRLQGRFGLINIHGQEKPGAEVLRSVFFER